MLRRIFSLPAIGIDLINSLFSTRHEQTEKTMEEREASRKKNWKHIDYKSGNDLEDHVRAFGDAPPCTHTTNPIITLAHCPFIDDETMYSTFLKDAKMPKEEAKPIVAASMTLPYFGKATNVYGGLGGLYGNFTPREVHGYRHAHSTGFYDERGNFNYDLFKGIINFSTRDPKDGKQVISRAGMQKFIDHLAKNNRRWDNANIIDDLIGKTANKGEYDSLFKIINTRWIEVDGEFVPHALVTNVKKWLTHTAKMLKEKREGRLELPPKPEVEEKNYNGLPKLCKDTPKQPEKNWVDKFLNDYILQPSKKLVDSTPSYHNSYLMFFGNGTASNQRVHCNVINTVSLISPPTVTTSICSPTGCR